MIAGRSLLCSTVARSGLERGSRFRLWRNPVQIRPLISLSIREALSVVRRTSPAMEGDMRRRKSAALAFTILVICTGLTTSSRTQTPGYVSVVFAKAGVIVLAGGGHGVLT